MIKEIKVYPSTLRTLSAVAVAQFIDVGYMTEWPHAWTRKGWRLLTSNRRRKPGK
jgi:transposase